MLLQQRRMLLEKSLAHLQRDRVHDGFSLTPFQTSQHNLELAGIQHERDLGNIGLGNGDLHKFLHRSETVKHAVIDVDVNDVSTILNLLLGNIHSRTVVASHHQLLKFDGTTDVATLTDVQKRHTQVIDNIIHDQIFQTRQPHLRSANIGKLARLVLSSFRSDSIDVCWCGPTTSSNHVQPSILEEGFVALSHILGSLIISSHGIRETSI